jgi:hypothetical protein
MATWIWILIGIAVVVVIALAVRGGKQRRQNEVDEQGVQARQLWEEADSREKLTRDAARDARRTSAGVGARAERIDPDSETPE